MYGRLFNHYFSFVKVFLKVFYIFRDIGVPNAWEFRKDNEKYQLDFTAPGVEVHCLYGSKVQTVEKYIIFTI